ncbi:uncharacterized protein LOC108670964 [Hyalella azteca]|uniref:Uncharacterized protein LOC108670964 n=1 Tax=Hyalella azteca TaxID=294128 RepID=A0A8B7NJW4_HYAAZ|nr:uncharacterized protein LOC108670964 [Hyalella azteca]
MASATIECDVCNEKFDSGNHKPLGLTCGHTFCFSCIKRLCNVPETKNCPKCRKPISQDADQLPVIFALIPTNEKSRPSAVGSPTEALCPQHQKALDYLCVDCMESVCFTCSRGTHAMHKIEMIDDLLQDNENVNDVWAKIRPTLQKKLDSVSSVVTLSDELSDVIEDIIKMKPYFDGWKDLLLVQKVSTEQDLQAWDASVTSHDGNKRLDCKEILCRLKLNFSDNGKLPEIKALLDAAAKTSASLELQTCEVMPTGKPWIITSSEEGERAVASLSNNIKPSRLVVLSTHTRPIPGLGELLSRLAAHHTGKISLLPLDYFWRPTGQSDGGLETIVHKLRGGLQGALYCSPYMAARTGIARDYNIRLGRPADVTWMAKLGGCAITNVCCAKGVPNNVGTTLKDGGVEVTRWHFPDLKDHDVDWLSHILSSYSDNRHQSVELVLPRARLTCEGIRQMFQKIPNIRVLYHEPDAAHLLTAARRSFNPAADCIELSTTNILQWI